MPGERAIVTSKGQLVIPANLRRRLGIRKGTVIVFTEESGRLILQPLTAAFIKNLRGSLSAGQIQGVKPESQKLEPSS